MEIGTLNQRITILEHRTVIDEIGNHINSTNFHILFRNIIYNVTGLIPLYDHNNYMKIEGEIRKAGASDGYS